MHLLPVFSMQEATCLTTYAVSYSSMQISQASETVKVFLRLTVRIKCFWASLATNGLQNGFDGFVEFQNTKMNEVSNCHGYAETCYDVYCSFFYIAVLCYFSFAPCMFLIDGICKSHFMIKADFQISLMEGQLSFVDCK